MIRFIIIIGIFFSFMQADSTLLVKKGWQLIGSSIDLNNMKKFKYDEVEEVWSFDATSQTWLAFSPDSKIQKKMFNKKISLLTEIKNWQGFWIKSKKNWTFHFEKLALENKPIIENSKKILELKKGWNLISLPIDKSISADLFKGMVVWKYSNQEEWEFFSSNSSSLDFPRLGHIKNSDGIWVKSDTDRNISIMDELSTLHTFNSFEELEFYIKESLNIHSQFNFGIRPYLYSSMRIDSSTFEMALSDEGVSGISAVSNASNTNLQEENVDESDILKHNSNYVFYIGKEDGQKREYINVSSFKELSTNKKIILNKLFLKGRYIESFYLVKDRLIVLSKKYKLQEDQLKSDGLKPWKQQGFIDIFDISSISSIQKIGNYAIDGTIKNSRIIGDKLYTVSQFSPQYILNYKKEYFVLSEDCKALMDGLVRIENINKDDYLTCDNYNVHVDENGSFRYNYAFADVEIIDLLPEIEGNNFSTKPLVEPTRAYSSSQYSSDLAITTLSAFSIENPTYIKSTSFMGNSSIEYASSNSLYLVSNEHPFFFDFYNYKDHSVIYKFNFDKNLSFGGVGSVSGRVLNQFALSEYKGVLRVATTERFSWFSANIENRLYTLSANNGVLSIQGVLGSLGKKGERIKSIRFIWDKAYLVTFREMDPLYTIDLSNPKRPVIMGDLNILGYSAYLHPIGKDKLLGIGQDADEEGRLKGVKIELFDISDLENPLSLDTILLEKGSSSELEYNHKALAYRSSDHLFSFPYSSYLDSFENYFTQHSLGIYQVKDNHLKSYAPIKDEAGSWNNKRGLIFDLNNSTYISFFSDGQVITKKLNKKDK